MLHHLYVSLEPFTILHVMLYIYWPIGLRWLQVKLGLTSNILMTSAFVLTDVR